MSIVFQEVLQCRDASLFEEQKSVAYIITSGLLRVFKTDDNLLLLRLNEFDLGIDPAEKVGSTWEDAEQR